MPAKIQIDEEQLINFMRTYPSLEDTCYFFKVSKDTIRRRIKQIAGKDVDFATFREQNMAWSRHMLKRKALQMALNGDKALLIFMLKNWCNMSDNPQNNDTEIMDYKLPETLKYDPQAAD